MAFRALPKLPVDAAHRMCGTDPPLVPTAMRCRSRSRSTGRRRAATGRQAWQSGSPLRPAARAGVIALCLLWSLPRRCSAKRCPRRLYARSTGRAHACHATTTRRRATAMTLRANERTRLNRIWRAPSATCCRLSSHRVLGDAASWRGRSMTIESGANCACSR